ncbi:MAG: hydroxymethylglutaryl-CoA reductase, degradative [archaeon]|nr:hydroxymethylglutaryl-CoA reductase, degradative [archaeon]
MNNIKSSITGFYKLSIQERQNLISSLCGLDEEEKLILRNFGNFPSEKADLMGENVIGTFQLPYSIATNFKINNIDYLIPMVTEEASVVAAASNGARIARKKGGFISQPVESIMIGQIQITKITNLEETKKIIMENKQKLISIANSCDEKLISLGGCIKDLELRELSTKRGNMIILHLLVDVLDAMGANAINTMVEVISDELATLIDGKIILKIISNLAIHRLAKCQAVFDKELLGGEKIVENILDAYSFAEADPYRATTHNKGIMNGISAFAIATGNDTRAIEAGAHSYASLNGRYKPLSTFKKDKDGNLVGELELPMPMATIGGIINQHPMTKISLKILNVKSAEELSKIAVALGLAQNVAALRALANEGIQKGHMKLHKKKQ